MRLKAALVIAVPALAAQGQGPGGVPGFFNLGNPLVLMVVTFGIFYFLLIAPARKRQKQLQQTINALKPGDKVVTSGGVLGTVVGVTDRVIQLKISDQVKIDVLKSAIAGLQSEDPQRG